MSENPSSLIAMRDSITAGRINMIMRQRGWQSRVIEGEDSLIDSYLKTRPRVVFLGLDTGGISFRGCRECDLNAHTSHGYREGLAQNNGRRPIRPRLGDA